MTQNAIDLIFEELKTRGQCNSRDTFSRDWLGKEASYYRSLHSKKRNPSVVAQLTLARRLHDLGSLLENSEHTVVASAGQLYLKLSARLVETLLHGAHSSATNVVGKLASS